MDQETSLQGRPGVLDGTVARNGIDADQMDPLETLADADFQPVGTEAAHKSGGEAPSSRFDLLGEEFGDLAQRESHDPAEPTEPDLSRLDPEPVNLDQHAARELEQVRAIAEGRQR